MNVCSERQHVPSQRFCAARRRSLCRPGGSCCWLCYRHRWRRWCKGNSTTAQALRWHGAQSRFNLISSILTMLYRSLSSFLPKSWVFTVYLLPETSVNVADPPSGLIVALIMNTRSQIMTVRSFYDLMAYFLCFYSVNERAVANSEPNVRRSARGTSRSIPESCLCKQCRRFLISSYLGALVDN